MAVPKKRKSHRRTRMGRSHHAIVPKGWTVIKETGEVVPPHCVSETGWYKGKKVFLTKEERKLDSKEA